MTSMHSLGRLHPDASMRLATARADSFLVPGFGPPWTAGAPLRPSVGALPSLPTDPSNWQWVWHAATSSACRHDTPSPRYALPVRRAVRVGSPVVPAARRVSGDRVLRVRCWAYGRHRRKVRTARLAVATTEMACVSMVETPYFMAPASYSPGARWKPGHVQWVKRHRRREGS